jgi:hypothetical protein
MLFGLSCLMFAVLLLSRRQLERNLEVATKRQDQWEYRLASYGKDLVIIGTIVWVALSIALIISIVQDWLGVY